MGTVRTSAALVAVALLASAPPFLDRGAEAARPERLRMTGRVELVTEDHLPDPSDPTDEGQAVDTVVLVGPEGRRLLEGPAARRLRAGSLVTATGDGTDTASVEGLADGTLDTSTGSVTVVTPAGPTALELAAAGVPQTKRFAAVLVKLTDTTVSFTAADARSTLTTVADFYRSASNGLLDLQVDAFGPYAVPFPASPCLTSTWADAADQAARAAGVPVDTYDYVTYLIPGWSCSATGYGTMPTRSYVKGLILGTITHELGHTLGANHASSYRCTEGGTAVALSATCTASEYGDIFDVMGQSSGMHPQNTFFRWRYDWLGDAGMAVAGRSGDYTLAPLPSTGSPRGLRVPRGDGTSLYVEYRQPSAYDKYGSTDPAVTGVMVRVSSSSNANFAKTLLVDAHPATTSFADAPLQVGETLTDPVSGVRLTLVARSTSAATMRVEVPADTTPPTAVTGVSGSAWNGAVKLTWTGASDNRDLLGFRVSRNGTELGVVGADATAFADSLAVGAGATYAVAALDAAGNAGPSASATLTGTADTTPPPVPANLTAIVTPPTSGNSGWVSLSWTKPVDAGSGVAAYRVHRDGQLYGTYPGSVSVSVVIGATNRWSVSAVDAAGNEGQRSAEVVTTMPGDAAAPSAPSGLVAVAANDILSLGWGPATDDGAVGLYRISRDGVTVGEVAGSARTWAGAAVSGIYDVRAVDLSGKQGAGASVVYGSGGTTTTTTAPPATTTTTVPSTTTTVPPATTTTTVPPVTTTTVPPATDTEAPSVPTGLTAAVRKGSRVVLAWNASTDNVRVAGYRVLRNQVVIATVATPGFEHRGVKGTSTYQVVAFDTAANASPASPGVTVKV